MLPMIQGTEHEYTLYHRRLQEQGVDPHTVGLRLLRESDLHAAGEFTTNQSRAYYDVGHLEISTPEVTNAIDLVVWEKAGEKIVDWLRKVIEERYLSAGERLLALKNNTAPDGTSYGSHENYCVPRSLPFPDAYVRGLVPHFVSRMIYTGAGDLLDGRYVLSPSLYKTSVMVSGNTMHGTGLLNTRDEPHAAPERWRRLHVLVGDALMSEPAILLRHFTTQGILQLLAEGKLEDAPQLRQPLEDMWTIVEHTNPERWCFDLVGGGTISPIAVQRYYLAKVETLVNEPWERQTLQRWERVLDLLEARATHKLARCVEWVDRYIAIGEAVASFPDDPEMAMKAAKQYSEVGADRSIFYQRQADGLIDRIIDDEQIIHAIHHPPHDTRAALRARLCALHEVTGIDWARLTHKVDGELQRLVLDDPWATELPAGGD